MKFRGCTAGSEDVPVEAFRYKVDPTEEWADGKIPLQAKPGEWIVKDSDGHLECFDDRTFHDEFEKETAEHRARTKYVEPKQSGRTSRKLRVRRRRDLIAIK